MFSLVTLTCPHVDAIPDEQQRLRLGSVCLSHLIVEANIADWLGSHKCLALPNALIFDKIFRNFHFILDEGSVCVSFYTGVHAKSLRITGYQCLFQYSVGITFGKAFLIPLGNDSSYIRFTEFRTLCTCFCVRFCGRICTSSYVSLLTMCTSVQRWERQAVT